MITFNHTQRWDDNRANFTGLHALTDADYKVAVRVLKGPRKPDLAIAPDGNPYLYRWHLVHLDEGLGFGQYFHIQVASDPERPLHDHPWDNTSIILAGRYEETVAFPGAGALLEPETIQRRTGELIARSAATAHRLVLPAGVPYAMTVFTMGPKIREWGFWYPEGWVNNKEVVRTTGDLSVHVSRQV